MMHSIKFFTQMLKSKSSSDRLVMSILCRNEIDIIEANIKTHATLGVDAFSRDIWIILLHYFSLVYFHFRLGY